MPIGRVARQSGDFEAHDDARLGERDFADEFLEAIAGDGVGSRLAEVAVDDVDALGRPACGDRAITQRILPLRALAVLGDLAQRRLTHIQIGVALKMIGGDFWIRHGLAPWQA